MELKSIATTLSQAIDQQSGTDQTKKTEYYKALNSALYSRWKQSTDSKEKRLLEYLHTRLDTIQKGLLPKDSSSTLSQASSIVTDTPVMNITAIHTSSPSLDFSNPVLKNYVFAQNKRFPKSITTILDGFTQKIGSKIDSKNISSDKKDMLYKQVSTALSTKASTTTDIKEQKFLQYIENHLFIRQQEMKLLR
jgi:hypothetical protein